MFYFVLGTWTFVNVSAGIYLFRKAKKIAARNKKSKRHYAEAARLEQEALERDSVSKGLLTAATQKANFQQKPVLN